MKDFIKKPPMGWNSWDCYGAGVTEDELLGNAGFMLYKRGSFEAKLPYEHSTNGQKSAKLFLFFAV